MDAGADIGSIANALTIISVIALAVYVNYSLYRLKAERKKKTNPIIVMIDGENMPSWSYEAIKELIQGQGSAIKKVYADWGVPANQSWRPTIKENGLEAVSVIPAIPGKNATDVHLTIDAVEIATKLDSTTFVFASSDTDFIPLYKKVRSLGHKVVVVGLDHTPISVQNATDHFILVVSPRDKAHRKEHPGEGDERNSKASAPLRASSDDMREALISAWRSVADDDGWAYVSDVGRVLTKRDQFDKITRGKSLSGALKDSGAFVTRIVENRMQIRCSSET